MTMANDDLIKELDRRIAREDKKIKYHKTQQIFAWKCRICIEFAAAKMPADIKTLTYGEASQWCVANGIKCVDDLPLEYRAKYYAERERIESDGEETPDTQTH